MMVLTTSDSVNTATSFKSIARLLEIQDSLLFLGRRCGIWSTVIA